MSFEVGDLYRVAGVQRLRGIHDLVVVDRKREPVAYSWGLWPLDQDTCGDREIHANSSWTGTVNNNHHAPVACAVDIRVVRRDKLRFA